MRICKLTGEPLGYYCEIWPALIGGLASIGGALVGSSAQASANRQNNANYQLTRQDAYQMARNEMDYNSAEAAITRQASADQFNVAMGFDREMLARQQQFNTEHYHDAKKYNTEMANTEVQRRMMDLERAGLNPMLAYSGAASSPSMQGANSSAPQANAPSMAQARAGGGTPARPMDIKSTQHGIHQAVANAINAYSASNQAKMQKAQIALVKEQTGTQSAQTRNVEAEAALKEAEVPFSAQNAQVKSLTLDRQFQILGVEIEKAIADRDLKNLDLHKMRPLVLEYQRLLNQSERLGLPEKEATAKMFETVPAAKWIEIVRRVMPSVNIGR